MRIKTIKWIIGIALLAIAVPGAKYLYGIMKYYQQAIKQSRDRSPCSYFTNLAIGTDIKTIEKDFSLPAPFNTLMGNSFYTDRIFEYEVSHGIIRVGLTSSDVDKFLFNGDYEIKIDTDSCSKWTERPAPCDTIEMKNREFVEHDYDGGAVLLGIYCKDELEHLHVEIGVSRGFYKQDYLIEDSELIRVKEIQDVFPYVDSIAGLDYSKLNREYEVTFEIKPNGIIKLDEKGEQALGDKMTDAQKHEEYKSKFKEYRKQIEEKKARAKKNQK